MQFDWNPEKARTNLAKHGVSFELARKVWDDPLHIIVPEGRVRIIGARKATAHERRRYEQEEA